MYEELNFTEVSLQATQMRSFDRICRSVNREFGIVDPLVMIRQNKSGIDGLFCSLRRL
jgi:hypothetical protein